MRITFVLLARTLLWNAERKNKKKPKIEKQNHNWTENKSKLNKIDSYRNHCPQHILYQAITFRDDELYDSFPLWASTVTKLPKPKFINQPLNQGMVINLTFCWKTNKTRRANKHYNHIQWSDAQNLNHVTDENTCMYL